MRSARPILRFLALPLAMAAFILVAQQSAGLVLRTGTAAQFASLR